MRDKSKMGSGRMNRTLRGLGDWDEYGNDVSAEIGYGTSFNNPVYDPQDEMTAYDVAHSATRDVYDPIFPGVVARPDDIQAMTTGMQPGETRNVITPDGKTVKVIAATQAPASPDLTAYYKIGSQLLRYAVAVSPQGQQYYQAQQVQQSNTFMLLGLAAAAFFLLS